MTAPDYEKNAHLSAIVLGWCDSAGCESVGHKANDCKLAAALKARDLRVSQAARKAAFEEAYDTFRAMIHLPQARRWLREKCQEAA